MSQGGYEKKCKVVIINHIAGKQLEYIEDQSTGNGIFDTIWSFLDGKPSLIYC